MTQQNEEEKRVELIRTYRKQGQKDDDVGVDLQFEPDQYFISELQNPVTSRKPILTLLRKNNDASSNKKFISSHLYK